MEKEDEDFLILDDDEYKSTELPDSSKKPIFNIRNDIVNQFSKIKKITHSNKEKIPKTLDLEDFSSLELDGVYEFDWDIRGMDCPDCAMKASKAIRRLSGIEDLSLIHI